LVDPEAPDLSEERFTASLDALAELEPEPDPEAIEAVEGMPTTTLATAAASQEELAPAAAPTPGSASEPDTYAWRNELSERLSRYRARRKIRPPRYPSLLLQFDAVESSGGSASSTVSSFPKFEPLSDQALALDGMREMPAAASSDAQPRPEASPTVPQAETTPVERSGAKILEFPRLAWGPPPPPDDQLAEPVMDRPRILEVPEAAPPPPALGGIMIEAAERQKAEKRPGIDFPLQGASLARRVLAGAADGLIIAAAAGLFGGIFWKGTGIRPPLIQILGLAAAIPCLCWGAYQYLLIVYATSTPGLRAAGLELARFDGIRPSRSLRRWRVLASYLSAASLGMGYLWVFLDEDGLCWHDRITHTYLAPKGQTSGHSKTSA